MGLVGHGTPVGGPRAHPPSQRAFRGPLLVPLRGREGVSACVVVGVRPRRVLGLPVPAPAFLSRVLSEEKATGAAENRQCPRQVGVRRVG